MTKKTKTNQGWINPKVKPAYNKIVIGAVLNENTNKIEIKPVNLLLTDDKGDFYVCAAENNNHAMLRDRIKIIAWQPMPEYTQIVNKPKK
jgi:hypothetical protein